MSWRKEDEWSYSEKRESKVRQVVDGLVEAANGTWDKLTTPFRKKEKRSDYWNDGLDGRDYAHERREKSAKRKRKLVQIGLAAALGVTAIGGLATTGVVGKAMDWLNNFVQPQVTQAYESTVTSTPTETPVAEVTLTPERISVQEYFGGKLKVEFDSENRPTAYTVDGVRTVVDEVKLLETGAWGGVDLGPVYSNTVSTREHPILDEKPEGVMTEQELKDHGVKIVQTDRVKLHIQKSAFEKNGLLEQFNAKDRKLVIVLVDSPLVDRWVMHDPKYDDSRRLLDGIIGNYDFDPELHRSQRLQLLQVELAELKVRLHASVRDSDEDLSEIKGQILSKTEEVMITKKLSPGELFVDYAMSDGYSGLGASGVYFMPEEIEGSLGQDYKNTAMIFLGVGGNGTAHRTGLFGIDDGGRFYATVREYQSYPGRDPNDLVSAPDPAKLLKLRDRYDPANPRSYPFGGQRYIDSTSHHELSHDKLVMGWKSSPGGNLSERDTDWAAYDSLMDSWLKWKDSGYTDTNAWQFIWETSDGRYKLGRPLGGGQGAGFLRELGLHKRGMGGVRARKAKITLRD